MAKPFVKWAGGKNYLKEEILKRFKGKVRRYYEPMVGGGATFFAAQEANLFREAVLADANEELILVYTLIRDDVDNLISHLKRVDHNYKKASDKEKYYYHIRDNIALENLKPVQRATRFLFLNRTCFNGLYRVNRRGKFNVPFGHYKNPNVVHEDVLRSASVALANVTLHGRDFEPVVENMAQSDLVYFDPPYYKLQDSSFTRYTRYDFSDDDHIRLAHLCTRLKSRGMRIILSNSDTPQVRKLYKNFKIEVVNVPRRINSDGQRRGKVQELIITSEEP